MTVLVFLFGGYFRERLLQFRNIENRVISKTIIAAGSLQDLSIDATANNCDRVPSPSNRYRTNKVRPPLVRSLVLKFREQFRDSIRARRVWTCVSRGMHPRRSVQRRHDEAGVIRENKSIMKPRVVQTFAQRVLAKRQLILIERGQGIEIREQRKCDLHLRHRACKRPKFIKFSRIG